MLIGVPAGNPVRVTTKVAVPDVMLPAESFVTSNVIVAVPLPVDSALLTGGTSFAGLRVAVNVGLVGGLFDGEFDELHAAVPMAMAATRTVRRFIVDSSSDQKNLRDRLNPRLSVSGLPPEAICRNVVPGLLVSVSEN